MKHLLKLPLCALAFAMTANTGFAQSSATEHRTLTGEPEKSAQ